MLIPGISSMDPVAGSSRKDSAPRSRDPPAGDPPGLGLGGDGLAVGAGVRPGSGETGCRLGGMVAEAGGVVADAAGGEGALVAGAGVPGLASGEAEVSGDEAGDSSATSVIAAAGAPEAWGWGDAGAGMAGSGRPGSSTRLPRIRLPSHDENTERWSLVTARARASPTFQTWMSGPEEPSAGRAEKANQDPSGEYAPMPPTTTTESAMAIVPLGSSGPDEAPGSRLGPRLGSSEATTVGPGVAPGSADAPDGEPAGALGGPEPGVDADGRGVGTATTRTEPPDAAGPLMTTR
jgi:hypothetical protein